MDRKVILAVIILVAVLPVLMACRGPDVTPAVPQGKELPRQGSTAAAAWEQKWNKTLADARSEGAVNVYVSAVWGSELRSSLTTAFKQKYDLNLEFTPLSGSEFAAKVKAEQRAGLNIADVYGAGTPSISSTLKPDGLLGSFEPVIILPEVLDTKAWRGGQLYQENADPTMVPMLIVAARTILYNTERVKPEEIDSFKDMLKPKFKEQITLLDPADGGAGSGLINHLVSVFGWDEAMKFTRDLLVQQKAIVFRDARLQTETVARGKYSIVLGGSGQYKADFIKLGAPVAVKIPKEGDYATASFGALAVPLKSPHPNASAIFVNWLLTREGQTIFARGAGAPSRRLDVPTDGIDPIFVPSPDEKIIQGDTPEINLRRPQVVEAAKKIMAEAEK